MTVQISDCAGKPVLKWELTDCPWVVVLGLPLVWNLFCKDGCTMSERADDYVVANRWLVCGLAYTLCAHITNTIPNQLDPVHLAFVGMRKLRHL